MKKLLLPLCCGVLVVLSAVNCGPAVSDEPEDAFGAVSSEARAATPAPAPALVTCASDSLGACTAATAGQPCTSGGKNGTCTSTYSGCSCVTP